MGMFDYIHCKAEVTEGYNPDDFQTKDLRCELLEYRLNGDGLFQLTELLEDSWGQREIEPRKINFTGLIRFYNLDVTFWCLMDRGKVLWIKNKEEL